MKLDFEKTVLLKDEIKTLKLVSRTNKYPVNKIDNEIFNLLFEKDFIDYNKTTVKDNFGT